jgi:hypothetical protein
MSRYSIRTANSTHAFLFGAPSIWRETNDYSEAKELALLHMAHEPMTVLAITDGITGRVMFTNNIVVKHSSKSFFTELMA